MATISTPSSPATELIYTDGGSPEAQWDCETTWEDERQRQERANERKQQEDKMGTLMATVAKLTERLEQLEQQWVLSLATVDARTGRAYACSVFYALARPDELGEHDAPILVFASDPSTTHGNHLAEDPRVAGTVHGEARDLSQIRGVQLRGTVIAERDDAPRWSAARRRYLDRHPAAAPFLGGARLYGLIVEWAKITDNRRGFGNHAVLQFSQRWL